MQEKTTRGVEQMYSQSETKYVDQRLPFPQDILFTGQRSLFPWQL